jgi:hypothetical protein
MKKPSHKIIMQLNVVNYKTNSKSKKTTLHLNHDDVSRDFVV